MTGEGGSFQGPSRRDDQHRTPQEPFHIDDSDAENGATLGPKWSLRRSFWTFWGRPVRYLQPNNQLEEMNGLMDGMNDHSPRSYTLKKNRSSCRWCICILESSLGLTLALLLLNLLFGFANILQDSEKLKEFAEWGKQGTSSEGLDWYPTEFLRDVIPIPCHSHNDYWREVPLFSALYTGCISIETDVWEMNNDLLIGHDLGSLTANRTFQSLYVNPLVQILKKQNSGNYALPGTSLGVFDTDSEQTLTLVIDVKTDGVKTWPLVLEQLEPLRQHGWLTYFQDKKAHSRPITIVGTGNTPFEAITANTTYRDAFYDAPLSNLYTDEESNPPPNAPYDPSNSYLASTSFVESIGRFWWWSLSSSQLETIRKNIGAAHALGIRARYWDLPGWPKGRRNYVWKVLIEEGVDLLNVDDLEDVKGLW